MDARKTFVGYDLGDGETVVDLATLSGQEIKTLTSTDIKGLTMPDCNDAGKAIPTAYGYTGDGELVFASSILQDAENVKDIQTNFKRRPSDLLEPLTDLRRTQLEALFKNGAWPSAQQCPEVCTPEMDAFRKSVQIFTNAIFEDPGCRKNIRDEAVDSEEIVFCVGHPTRWDKLDVEIYEAILRGSALGKSTYEGKPCSLIMAAESRAAFLYVRDKANSSVLPKGTCALLVDIGSSTIDLTAMTADSRNHVYNSGSNYLGARSIDFMIRERYLENMRRNSEDWMVYEKLIALNPSLEKALALSCRRAKEEIYSVKAQKSHINFCDFKPETLTKAIVDQMISTVPVAPLLQKYSDLPEGEAAVMGAETWKSLFRQFLMDRKAEMTAEGVKLGRAIVTGSASKMPVASEIIQEVFSELSERGVLSDMDPSRSISKGLVLVGASNEKSKKFQADLAGMMEEELPQVIGDDIPALADKIGAMLENVIGGTIRRRMIQWRDGAFTTLNDMMAQIEQDCSEKQLSRLLTENRDYQNAVSGWMTDVVGQDVAVKLQGLCKTYNVSDFTLDSLNVMKVPQISVGGMKVNPTDDMMNVLGGLVSLIGGVIAYAILPSVLALITVLLSLISVNLAVGLFGLLMAIPGPGWALLAVIAGVGVATLVKNGVESVKTVVTQRIQGWDLPSFARKLMSDKKIDEEIRKASLRGKIKASILEEESKRQVTASVLENLRGQIEKRAEDIKYVIESR